jgi:hypothetical protein
LLIIRTKKPPAKGAFRCDCMPLVNLRAGSTRTAAKER